MQNSITLIRKAKRMNRKRKIKKTEKEKMKKNGELKKGVWVKGETAA